MSGYDDLPDDTDQNEFEDMHYLMLEDNRKPNISTIIWHVSIVLCVTVVALLWLNKPKPQHREFVVSGLSTAEVSFFKEVSAKVAEFDVAIAAEEQTIKNLQRLDDSKDRKATSQRYEHLATRSMLIADRGVHAKHYNLAASRTALRISIPIAAELRRHGLPVSIL